LKDKNGGVFIFLFAQNSLAFPQRKECLFEVSKTAYVWPKLWSDWLMAANLRVQEHFDGKGGRGGAYQNNYLSCLQI
jgi:hypothetical protein